MKNILLSILFSLPILLCGQSDTTGQHRMIRGLVDYRNELIARNTEGSKKLYLLEDLWKVEGKEEINAQDAKRNLLQVKHTLNYYKGYKPSLLYSLFFPDVTYKRFSKNKQRFVEIGTDILQITYRDFNGEQSLGRIFFRDQYILEGKVGGYLVVTPHLKAMVKAGMGYRLGEESIIVDVFINNWLNIPTYVVENYNYNDIGFNASCEFLYQFCKRWSLSLEGGGRYFLNRRIISNSQLWVDLGIGYAF